MLLRRAFERHGGHVLGTEGDQFFVAFESAGDAAAAAAGAQHALAEEEWPDGNEVRVRMGLHTGEPRQVEGGYVGLDVHQAARVMAAGHGGQVLVSATTRALLGPTVRAARPRRARAQGPRSAPSSCTNSSSRVAERVPAPEHAGQPVHEPALGPERVYRPRARARRGRGAARTGRGAAADTDRHRRNGQDAAGSSAGGEHDRAASRAARSSSCSRPSGNGSSSCRRSRRHSACATSLARARLRRSASTCATSGCCSYSTTSSRCSPPRPHSRACWPRRPA